MIAFVHSIDGLDADAGIFQAFLFQSGVIDLQYTAQYQSMQYGHIEAADRVVPSLAINLKLDAFFRLQNTELVPIQPVEPETGHSILLQGREPMFQRCRCVGVRRNCFRVEVLGEFLFERIQRILFQPLYHAMGGQHQEVGIFGGGDGHHYVIVGRIVPARRVGGTSLQAVIEGCLVAVVSVGYVQHFVGQQLGYFCEGGFVGNGPHGEFHAVFVYGTRSGSFDDIGEHRLEAFRFVAEEHHDRAEVYVAGLEEAHTVFPRLAHRLLMRADASGCEVLQLNPGHEA